MSHEMRGRGAWGREGQNSEDILEHMVTLVYPHDCLSPGVTLASPHSSRKKRERLDLCLCVCCCCLCHRGNFVPAFP